MVLTIGDFQAQDADRPVMMYDRDNPSIGEGVVFPSAIDCRNAVATFSIKSETEFIILKSDTTRFTVKCASKRCKWRLHASLMRRSTLFQVLMHFLLSVVSIVIVKQFCCIYQLFVLLISRLRSTLTLTIVQVLIDLRD